MKAKPLALGLAGLVAGGLLAWLLLPARLPNHVKAAERNSFDAVTARLDSGGEVYAYLSTERVIRTVSDLITQVLAVPAPAGAARPVDMPKVMTFLKKIGLHEISGAGISMVSLAGGLSRTKMVLHHYPDQNRGVIWRIVGDEPRPLDELKLLPADTVLAAFGEYHLEPLWQFLKGEIGAAGGPAATGVNTLEPLLAMGGIRLDQLLKSLTGPMGYLVTLDPGKTVTLPAGTTPLTIPQPALAVVLAVRDATLFDLIKAKSPSLARYDERKGRRTLHFAPFKLPFPFDPLIVQTDGYLIAASTSALAETMLRAREKGDGLVATGEFAELARHVPEVGNGFHYLGSRLWKVYAGILGRIVSEKAPSAGDSAALKAVFERIPQDIRVFGVIRCDREGAVYTACCNLKPEMAIALPAAMLAGIAVANSRREPPATPSTTTGD